MTFQFNTISEIVLHRVVVDAVLVAFACVLPGCNEGHEDQVKGEHGSLEVGAKEGLRVSLVAMDKLQSGEERMRNKIYLILVCRKQAIRFVPV